MRVFRLIPRNIVGFVPALVILLTSRNAFGQAPIDGEIPSEGITSYIFSPIVITVLLILALIAQIVYWYYSRNSVRKTPDVGAVPAQIEHTKKRYDRESMSKLLKASATSKSNARSLEEAIRLSKLTQPTLPVRAEVANPDSVDEPEPTSQDAASTNGNEEGTEAELSSSENG